MKYYFVLVRNIGVHTCSEYVLCLFVQRSPCRERNIWINRLKTPLTEWRRWRPWCRNLRRTTRSFWMPWKRPRSRKRCLTALFVSDISTDATMRLRFYNFLMINGLTQPFSFKKFTGVESALTTLFTFSATYIQQQQKQKRLIRKWIKTKCI